MKSENSSTLLAMQLNTRSKSYNFPELCTNFPELFLKHEDYTCFTKKKKKKK